MNIKLSWIVFLLLLLSVVAFVIGFLEGVQKWM